MALSEGDVHRVQPEEQRRGARDPRPGAELPREPEGDRRRRQVHEQAEQVEPPRGPVAQHPGLGCIQ